MAISRTGAVLPNGNFIPQLYATKMIAQYVGNSVVPLISNHDYDGEISKLGDKINIRKRADVDIFDGVIGGNLQTQTTMADESLQLTIDFYKYFNFPVNDVDKFQSDLDYQEQIMDQAQKNMAIAVEKSVLQTIHTSAGTSQTAASVSGANILDFIIQAGESLDDKLVPQEDRWLVIPAKFKSRLMKSDLAKYINTGETESPLRTGTVINHPVAGFKVYYSPYLTSTSTTAKILAGHMDALCFAGQINELENVRSETMFANKIRGQIVYGFKVVKPEALHLIDVTSYAAL